MINKFLTILFNLVHADNLNLLVLVFDYNYLHVFNNFYLYILKEGIYKKVEGYLL